MSALKRPDPAPSRWSWRMQRILLTPGFRLLMRAGLPFAVCLGVGVWVLSDPNTQTAIQDAVTEARASVEQRPEFMVNLMAIDGASSDLAAEVRAAIPLDFPMSSFDLDPDVVRDTVLEIAAVKEASVRVRPGGVLQVDIMPRLPVAIWRRPEGLSLVDAEGATVGPIARRVLRPDLPVIAGEGADKHVREALQVLAAGAPLGERLRGLVRLGDRRWDIVLDREQRIMLPSQGAIQALERLIALDGVDDLLARDVARIDLRLVDRPTVRMTRFATEEWWRIRQVNSRNE